MSAADTVSVVIPCYNAAAWIGGSVASVYDQGWPNLEVLVVDDGSRDDSVERVRARFPSARIVQQANAGVAAARNAGIRAATGCWVAFLDADDIWLPGKLSAQMTLLAGEPAASMAYSGWWVWRSHAPHPSEADITELAALEAREPERWRGPSGWIYTDLLLGCRVWTSTVVARRDLLMELGGFDPALSIGEDYDLWLRASRITPILRACRPLALYRQHPSSLTNQLPRQNYEASVVERAIARWGYSSPDGRQADPREVRQSLARTWHTFGSAYLAAGRPDVGAVSARRALSQDWRHIGAWKLLLKCCMPPLARSRRGSA